MNIVNNTNIYDTYMAVAKTREEALQGTKSSDHLTEAEKRVRIREIEVQERMLKRQKELEERLWG